MTCQWHNCTIDKVKDYVIVEDNKSYHTTICDEHYLDIRSAGKVKIYDLEQSYRPRIVVINDKKESGMKP